MAASVIELVRHSGDPVRRASPHYPATAYPCNNVALSHHFPTKKALGLAVIRHRVADAVEEAWIRPFKLAPRAAEGIQAAFEAVVSELEQKGAVSGCPLNNLALELSRQDGDFQVAIDAIFVRWRSAIADKLRVDLHSGAVRDLDPEAMATLVVAAYSGAMAMAKACQGVEPLKICATQLLSMIQKQARPQARRRLG